jgi:hypothetical protein
MTASQTKNISYTQTEEFHSAIKYHTVEKFDRYNTVADFTRKAISDQAEDIHEFAEGGRIANRLVRRLSRIRGVDEEEANAKPPSHIIEDDFGRSLSVNITLQQDGKLSDLQDETKLDRSQAVQYCQFRTLAKLANKYDIFDGGTEREMIQTWAELKGSLIDPKLNLHYVLTKRLVHQRDTTYYFIENDRRPFEEFAEVYRDEFYETDLYHSLVDLFGEHSLTNTENVIEEYTDVALDHQEDSTFLEEFRDGLE